MSRRTLALLLAAATTLTACGGGDQSPAEIVRAASRETAELRSATLAMTVEASAGTGTETAFGFTLNGPFDLGGDGTLPVARMAYEQRVGTKSEQVTFISTGSEAFVEVDGVAYRLPDDKVAGLRRAGSTGPSSGGLSELRFDRWISEPERADGEELDGVATDKLTGTLEAAAALSDLTRLASRLGASQAVQPLSEVDAETLRRVAKGSKLELWVGTDDDVLRRLALTITLGAETAGSLPEPLRAMAPVTLTVRLDLTDVGDDVTVEAPQDARPFAELPRD